MPFADNSHLHMISVMSFMQRIMHITFWENQQAKTQNNSNAANVMSPGCNADIIYATSPLRSISDIAISCSIVYHNKLWKNMLKVNEEKTITQTKNWDTTHCSPLDMKCHFLCWQELWHFSCYVNINHFLGLWGHLHCEIGSSSVEISLFFLFFYLPASEYVSCYWKKGFL